MFVFGWQWLTGRARRAARAGEGYGEHPLDHLDVSPTAAEPPLAVALTPLVIVLLVNLIVTRWLLPALDLSYLSEPRFGRVTVNEVRGIWALILSLGLAIVSAMALHWPRWTDLKNSINLGTMSSLLPIFNTASEIAYGAVIASLAAFAVVQAALVGISSNVLVSEAVSVNIMAGITGSATGGLSLALGMLGKTYAELAAASNISPELLHRVGAIACGGLDSLPHNGAVITLLGICRLTHKESYLDIFMCTVIGPLIALTIVVALGSTFGAF